MAFDINWSADGQVVDIALYNHVSLDEMQVINQRVMETIDQTSGKIAVLIDVSRLNTGYYTVEHLRTTQQYMHSQKVDAIVVVSDNKLNRLIGLLVFNLTYIPLFQFDDSAQAHRHLEERGFLLSASS